MAVRKAKAKRGRSPVEFSLVEDDSGRVSLNWSESGTRVNLSVKKDTLESAFVQGITRAMMLMARNTELPRVPPVSVEKKQKRGE